MKKEEINIRIEPLLKKDFKNMCEFNGFTMSEKLIELIEREVYSANSVKLTILRKIIEPFISSIYFEPINNYKNLIQDHIKKYVSFDFIISDIVYKDGVWSGQIIVEDYGKQYLLDYSIINKPLI